MEGSGVKWLPIRGGNRNNGGNAGLGALNLNNVRTNSNTNIGFRPRSQISDGQKLPGYGPAPSADLKGRQIHGRSRKILRELRVVSGKERPATLALTGNVMAKTYNGLFEEIITFESLYGAYLRARKGKRKSWPCRHFEQDLEGNLIQLQNELIWGKYQTGPYRSFYVTEPKRRKITALKLFRDRVVQHAIVGAIEPIWERRFIGHSYACRPGKGTHCGAATAQRMLQQCLRKHGKVYVLKADISKYFASIDHDILLSLLRKRIADARLMSVIEDIIRSYSEPESPGKGLPIGNLTSQLFANLYLDAFDDWIKCRRRERWYVRYMDDCIVVHHDKRHLQALRIDCQRWLSDNLDLATNRKTDVFPVAHHGGRGLDFLGFHLWPDGRRLRKASLRRFRRQVRQWQSLYESGDIDLSDIRLELHSWANHAKHGDALPAVAAILNQSPFRRHPDDSRRPNVRRRNSSRNPRRVGAAKAA
ncbi:reverse transcriptase/maturase family protein [Marinobacter bryozoorum]|uniref:reverse transcriptase/maturase family protein n=1 Tax=Marinobacter bryozoorum TaxID=256324 RepID=UPI002003E0C5|nr:reverse transcriptase/maturase family protein [Marinobacter bryozoorum]MCK7542963.1 reverse transcriptase/maturase family protein [Marinobacter bryozoorum]